MLLLVIWLLVTLVILVLKMRLRLLLLLAIRRWYVAWLLTVLMFQLLLLLLIAMLILGLLLLLLLLLIAILMLVLSLLLEMLTELLLLRFPILFFTVMMLHLQKWRIWSNHDVGGRVPDRRIRPDVRKRILRHLAQRPLLLHPLLPVSVHKDGPLHAEDLLDREPRPDPSLLLLGVERAVDGQLLGFFLLCPSQSGGRWRRAFLQLSDVAAATVAAPE